MSANAPISRGSLETDVFGFTFQTTGLGTGGQFGIWSQAIVDGVATPVKTKEPSVIPATTLSRVRDLTIVNGNLEESSSSSTREYLFRLLDPLGNYMDIQFPTAFGDSPAFCPGELVIDGNWQSVLIYIYQGGFDERNTIYFKWRGWRQ